MSKEDELIIYNGALYRTDTGEKTLELTDGEIMSKPKLGEEAGSMGESKREKVFFVFGEGDKYTIDYPVHGESGGSELNAIMALAYKARQQDEMIDELHSEIEKLRQSKENTVTEDWRNHLGRRGDR